MNLFVIFAVLISFSFMSCEKEDVEKDKSETEKNQSQNEQNQSNEEEETVHYYKETCKEQFKACIDCCEENCQHSIETCTDACQAAYIDCKSSSGSIANPFIHPPKFSFSIDKITGDTESFVVRIDDNDFSNVTIQAGRGIYNEDGSFEYKANLDDIGAAEYNESSDQWVRTVELPLNSINEDIDQLGIEAKASKDGDTYLGARLIDVEK